MKEHGTYYMRRIKETISMGCCKTRFINNQNNGTYTIIFKYRKAKDCRNYSKVLLDKINEAKNAYEGNREITVDEKWNSVVVTNAIDNGIDMVVYMEDFDLTLELNYYILEKFLEGGEDEE